MKDRGRFALWLAAGFAAVAVPLVAAAGLLLAIAAADDRAVLARVLDERAPLIAFLAFIALAFWGSLLAWLVRRYVAPLRELAAQTRIVATANPAHRVSAAGGAEAAQLAAAINQLGDAYRRQDAETEARMAESQARLAEERNRLAALMSELAEGVLVCNPQGRILLYNEHARALFGAAHVGLGRSLFLFLDRDQVAHALDKVRHALDRGAAAPVTVFFATPAAGGLVRVRVAPFLAPDAAIAGLMLTCEDVSRAFLQESQRHALLQSLATRVRQPAANVRAAAENLTTYPEMGEDDRARFAEIIAAESRALSATIDEALREYADALTAALTLEPMRLADLVDVVRRRIAALPDLAAHAAPVDEAPWVNVDSYALAQALETLAARLRDEHGVRAVSLRAAVEGGFARLDLAWEGAPLALDALERWEALPVQAGADPAPLTIRHVVDRHGGELWHQSGPPGAGPGLRFLLPLAEPAAGPPRRRISAESRPEYYDFDLFRLAAHARDLLGQPLAQLSYTVFDTETTGVEPSAGDRIISLGAVRIVNGRLLKQEAYEQLVDPQRPVPADSVRIHGIRAQDLAGQPVLRAVLPAFQRFCEDTVLVAHNAAFDMRFLELAEEESGVRFTQPVLDTLLLSAVVHGDLQDHGLEAIAERLGVAVVGRHTALGDALMTGEIFLRLLPLLAQHGVTTLGEALEASRETYYARLQY